MKNWIRQLSESYIKLNEQYNFERAHDELRRTGTTSFHYMDSPHVEHFGLTSTGKGINPPTDPVTVHPEHGVLRVERIGDRYHLFKT
jgi:hypothetical protein